MINIREFSKSILGCVAISPLGFIFKDTPKFKVGDKISDGKVIRVLKAKEYAKNIDVPLGELGCDSWTKATKNNEFVYCVRFNTPKRLLTDKEVEIAMEQFRKKGDYSTTIHGYPVDSRHWLNHLKNVTSHFICFNHEQIQERFASEKTT